MFIKIKIQNEDFCIAKQQNILLENTKNCGAVSSFVGIVRQKDKLDKNLESLFIEHYPGMTENSIKETISNAKKKFDIQGVVVIHRVGLIKANEQIVMVLTSSQHRKDAFMATQYIMDFLKTQAPLWKKENYADSSNWVEAKTSDKNIADSWEK
jgi:molybdopterin synthase catalytic subunit